MDSVKGYSGPTSLFSAVRIPAILLEKFFELALVLARFALQHVPRQLDAQESSVFGGMRYSGKDR
jgi:hypothetical protein